MTATEMQHRTSRLWPCNRKRELREPQGSLGVRCFARNIATILLHGEQQPKNPPPLQGGGSVQYSRLFERYRKQHKLIIPIAIFTGRHSNDEPDTLTAAIPEHEILRFQFLKVTLNSLQWRSFIDSNNPVAAALLAKMQYNEKERIQLRIAFLRMILRLRHHLDDARLALIMSVNDLYFKPNYEEDQIAFEQLSDQIEEEGAGVMELMPAWKKWGYDEGIQDGMEKGKEEGKAIGQEEIIRKFLNKGFTPEWIAETIDAPVDNIRMLLKP